MPSAVRPESIQVQGPVYSLVPSSLKRSKDIQSGSIVLRQQKPVSQQALRKDILDGEYNRLSVDADLHGQCTSSKCTDKLVNLYYPRFKGTYIGYSTKAINPEPERAVKNRWTPASLFLAARWAWKPPWCRVTRYPKQASVSQTQRAEVCSAKEPR